MNYRNEGEFNNAWSDTDWANPQTTRPASRTRAPSTFPWGPVIIALFIFACVTCLGYSAWLLAHPIR